MGKRYSQCVKKDLHAAKNRASKQFIPTQNALLWQKTEFQERSNNSIHDNIVCEFFISENFSYTHYRPIHQIPLRAQICFECFLIEMKIFIGADPYRAHGILPGTVITPTP
jgi:hypothetical protein